VGSQVKNFKVGDEVFFAGVINRNGNEILPVNKLNFNFVL